MNLLLIINYLIWIYDAITYDKRLSNASDIMRDMAQQLKPIILLISLIPYSSLIGLIMWPIIKKYNNI